MVTFSTNDTELNRKLGGIKRKKKDKNITIISKEEFTDYKEDVYICECGTTLEYNKIDDAL